MSAFVSDGCTVQHAWHVQYKPTMQCFGCGNIDNDSNCSQTEDSPVSVCQFPLVPLEPKQRWCCCCVLKPSDVRAGGETIKQMEGEKEGILENKAELWVTHLFPHWNTAALCWAVKPLSSFQLLKLQSDAPQTASVSTWEPAAAVWKCDDVFTLSRWLMARRKTTSGVFLWSSLPTEWKHLLLRHCFRF